MNQGEFYIRMKGYYGEYDKERDVELVSSIVEELNRISESAYDALYVALIRSRPRNFGTCDVAAIAAAAAILRKAGISVDRPLQEQPCPVCMTVASASSWSCLTCGLDLNDRKDSRKVSEHAAWWSDWKSGKVKRFSLLEAFREIEMKREEESKINHRIESSKSAASVLTRYVETIDK
jgi:hypothetical protein